MPTAGRKVVFLDRDGTINVDFGYVGEVARWQFTPGAPAGLRRLQEAGFALAVVSNQAGVADGRFNASDVERLHDHMRAELARCGVTIDAIAVCLHDREAGCRCRKPATGLALEVSNALGAIDYTRSWTIGDKESDIAFGQALGTQTALIRSRYWTAGTLAVQPGLVVGSLAEFACIVAPPLAS